MVGEDLDEGVVVLRLDEVVDGAGGELGEGFVGGGEDGEGAGAFEGVDQACSLDGGDEGLVDGRVDGVLDDVFGGNISAPPTVGSFIWALAAKEVIASAAPAMRVSRDFFILFSLSRLLL